MILSSYSQLPSFQPLSKRRSCKRFLITPIDIRLITCHVKKICYQIWSKLPRSIHGRPTHSLVAKIESFCHQVLDTRISRSPHKVTWGVTILCRGDWNLLQDSNTDPFDDCWRWQNLWVQGTKSGQNLVILLFTIGFKHLKSKLVLYKYQQLDLKNYGGLRSLYCKLVTS